MENYNSPLKLGEIISRGFETLVKNIADVLIIGAIFLIPVALFKAATNGVGISIEYTSIFEQSIPNINYSGAGILVAVLNTVLDFLFGIYASSSVIKLLYERSKGNYITFKEAIAYSFENKGKIFIVNLVLSLILIGIGIIFAIVIMILTLILSFIGILLAFIAILVFGALLISIFPMYISVLVIKDLEISDVYQTTNSFYKGEAFKRNIGRALGIGFMCLILSLIVGFVDGIPFLGAIIVTIGGFIISSLVSSCNNIIVEDELPEYEYDILGDDSNNNWNE